MARNFSLEKFNYVILDVDDTYQWGAHAVPRSGVEIVLTNLETVEEKRFYLAGDHNKQALSDHMDSLTDDLMGQWFNKREKKAKKPKVEA